ncbi:MAG: hypothetical protein JW966_15925 [Anaerolineae bacterium]|nr:hypothetical protein [Anaerolineae bacterium]
MTIHETASGTGETHQPAGHDHDDNVLYCTVHPHVETMLRCNKCGRPMCTRCAVKTPVGYRCRECVREQQNKFFNAQILDYMIAAAVAVVISFVAALILARLWFFFAFFAAPVAGGLIGRVILQLTGKRRGRYTGVLVGAGVVLGALPFLLLNPLSVGIFLFLATSTAVAQFGLYI